LGSLGQFVEVREALIPVRGRKLVVDRLTELV